jgi:amino acid adenylation domain-containing protein
VYFEQLSCRIAGGLDVAAFRRAWQTVVERHPVLRTAFLWDGLAEPLQVVRRRVELVWQEADWRGLEASEQQARVAEALARDRQRDFELERAPLLRLALFRVGQEAYCFVWSYHHLLLDGWSSTAVLGEIFACYRAYERGEEPRLSLARPYRDYIAWLQRQPLALSEPFWREALRGLRAPTVLALERPGGESGGPPAGHLSVEMRLSPDSTQRLEALARRRQVTLNTVVQGAWALLLGRYSGDEDVVFGATVAGRPAELSGVESMLGLFINTLPVRVRLESQQRLGAYLSRLLQQQLEARQHESTPLVEIQGWSEVPRGTPLFESILVFENYPVDRSVREQSGPALDIAGVTKHDRTSYPLVLEVTPERELRLLVDGDGGRFEAAALQRLSGHLRTLLEEMGTESERRLEELALLSAAERGQLLVAWNDTSAAYPWRRIDELIVEQSRRTPEAIAVVYEEAQLSYGELDRRSSRLGGHLASLGVGPEVRVAICAERSLELVVGLLAILKAGGAYVPVDPDYPRERVEYMLADSAVRVVLTQQRLVQELPAACGRVVCLDEEGETRDECEDGARGAGPQSLAYVIYTSGSTGRPKGVQIPHQCLVSFVSELGRCLGSGAGDRLLSVTSPSFDIFGLELFVPLAYGSQVCLASREATLDGTLLARKLEEAQPTLLQATPATWRMLLAAGWRGSGSLRLLCGGEALTADLAGRLLDKGRELWNLYGPTETTIWSTVCRVESARAPVSIGRPIGNTELFVLDVGCLQPAPLGVAGELYIGGDGLARGYLRRGDLTADRFVPSPFAANGERLYRTGDLARYRPDGSVELLGRTDHQVKVRGFRIELEEIEAALGRHAGVGQAVVIAREDRPDDQRLVAYVTAGSGGVPGAGELRSHLAAQLPEHMLPSTFVSLERMPLTPNGKVDRRALPAPGGDRPDPARESVRPRTAVEEVLAAIWAEVLGLERVEVSDNFFEIGGHSLLATRLLGRIKDAFAVDLPVRAIFDRPTVADFARQVGAQMRAGRGTAFPPLTRRSPAARSPLSFAQQRLWFLEQLEPGRAVYNELAGVELIGPLNVAALERSLQEVVRRHEVLRTTFEMADGSPVQVVHAELAVELPVVDLGELDGAVRDHEIRRRAEAATREPFDLACGPLVRGLVLRLNAADHVVLLAMHHIVSDGWSMGILIRDVSSLYTAFSQGRPSPLPELSIQYADFARWQREWLQGEVLAGQVAYWRDRLAGLAPVLRLPADRARPSAQTHRGAVELFALPLPLSEGLRRLSRREGVTLYMTLLSAFQALLGRYAGEEDVAVGSAIAGRTQSELEELIGFFVNTLVMRTDLAGDPTSRQLLRRVREVALGAYAHQDVPFEKLVEELQPQRNLSHHPLFQVMFVLQNAPREELKLPELRIRLLAGSTSVAKFDLALSMFEAEGMLHGACEYSTDLFERVTIRRLVAHFGSLLEGMAADPAARLLRAPLTSEAERHQLLAEWSSTAMGEPAQLCLHELFERQAARSPDATAIVSEDRRLRYGELDRRANQLARHLRELGVGPETRVGIYVERTPEMVVGLLSILKAGGAYVPLDPDYPRERLAFILEDAGVEVVLSQELLSGEVSRPGATVVCLDRDWGTIAWEEGSPPESRVGPDNLAYGIYTSGSTGRPKGVMIPHRGAVNYLLWAISAYQVGAGQGAPVHSSIGFDLTVTSLWAPLLAGRSVFLLRDSSPAAALIAAEEEGFDLSLIKITPAHLRMLEEELLRPALAARAGAWVIGGEELSYEAIAHWRRAAPRARWINEYGPTETVVGCIVHEIPADGPPAGPVPIGRPIAGTQVYVADRQGGPAPVGLPGELCIGGEGLARGYLHRGDLTAERFVPNPFAGAGCRLYRTGDLARWLPDGTLEFLGRIDRQVKVRGFRIEPGEVETALLRQPGVERAVVICREDRPGDGRLVAYVVPEWRQPPSEGDPLDAGALAAQISRWQGLFDEVHAGSGGAADPTFDVRGWSSSYTGLEIPAAEMREWVDHTVQWILALRPRRVLEIGCGTGLLLFRIAPHCGEYWATDFAAPAIDRLRELVDRPRSGMAHVRLYQRPADDFSGVEEGAFDLVILNSVVQYFPGVRYLLRVLEGAVAAVRDGGFVFVGDVRSLPLLDALHASVQLQRAEPALRRAQLRQRVERAKSQEKELVLAPAFFQALPGHLPRLGAAEVRLKRGRHHNELTRFRFDATLHVGPPRCGDVAAPTLDWEAERLTLAGLRLLLEQTNPSAVCLRRVPNARLARESVALRWFTGGAGPATVGDLRAAWAGAGEPGVDPEDLQSLGGELSYTAAMTWSAHDREGRYDVLLVRRQEGVAADHLLATAAPEPAPQDWQEVANDPLRGVLDRQLVASLRAAVNAALPTFMVPAAFVVVDALPTTPNGKVDRRALPAPDSERLELEAGYEAPRTPVEQVLAEVWSETLGLDRVGVRENFFALGGDSFQIMKVVARAGSRGLPVTPRMLFRHQTIAALADGLYDGVESGLGSLLVPFATGGTGLPFFCVHPAGGRVQFFWPLGNRLGASRPFYGIRAANGAGGRSAACRAEDIAAEYVAEIKTVQPRGPYCIGGYSLGVFLAFEMARQLVAAGERVSLLALLDAAVYRPADDDPHAIRHLIAAASHHGGVQLSEEELRLVTPDRLLEHVLGEIGRRSTAPAEVLDTLRAVLPAGYRNKLAVDEYMSRVVAAPEKHRYPGRITVFRAGEEAAGEPNAASALGWSARHELDMGWSRLAVGTVEVHAVPGDHSSFLDEPQVAVLAGALRGCLEQADEDVPI